MALRPIVTYPDPVLEERAAEVEAVDDEIRELVRDMAETMYAAPGVGLAANQVGVPRRVVVIDIQDPESHQGLLALINPQIVEADGQVVWEEGCLSLPGVNEDIQRAARVKALAVGVDGEPFEIEAGGLLAVAIQHELDHLDGVTLLDRVSGLKRNLLKRKLRKEKKERGAEEAANG